MAVYSRETKILSYEIFKRGLEEMVNNNQVKYVVHQMMQSAIKESKAGWWGRAYGQPGLVRVLKVDYNSPVLGNSR